MRRQSAPIVALFALILALAPAARPAPLADSLYIPLILGGLVASPTTTAEPLFLVTHIIDSDPINVEVGGITYRVRYIGIDTPERGDCYFDEAKAKNTAFVMGQYVRLVKDVSETDQYGWLLRCVCVGQVFANYELVWQGYVLAQHEAQEAGWVCGRYGAEYRRIG